MIDPAADLLALTADLVDIPSVSHDEEAITGWLEEQLRAVPWLDVERVERNLVARTDLGPSMRLILAGHTATVPVKRTTGPASTATRYGGLAPAT